MEGLLWMVVGATAWLLGLKLGTKGGLLPPAALPLTQGCHVEELPPDTGGIRLIVHTDKADESADTREDTVANTVISAKANKDLHAPLLSVACHSVIDGKDRPVSGHVTARITWNISSIYLHQITGKPRLHVNVFKPHDVIRHTQQHMSLTRFHEGYFSGAIRHGIRWSRIRKA